MPTLPPNIRQWSISISIALLVITGLVIGAIFFLQANQEQAIEKRNPYANNVLSPPRPAMPFNLTNHHGNSVSLEAFGSNPILSTFLYTNCTKTCPITTAKLRLLARMPATSENQLEIVVISVDPERDSIASTHSYSKQWEMENGWHYLTGTREELEPIWEYYWARPTSQVTTEPIAGYISHSPPLFMIVNLEIILAMSNDTFEANTFVEYLATLGEN